MGFSGSTNLQDRGIPSMFAQPPLSERELQGWAVGRVEEPPSILDDDALTYASAALETAAKVTYGATSEEARELAARLHPVGPPPPRALGSEACVVTPLAPGPPPFARPSPPVSHPSKTMSYASDYDREKEVLWAATLSPSGEVLIESYTRQGYDWVSSRGERGHFNQAQLCASAEEALNRVRTSVQLIKLDFPQPSAATGALTVAQREALVHTWRTEVIAQLRAELSPAMRGEMLADSAPRGFAYDALRRAFYPADFDLIREHYGLVLHPKENPMSTTPTSTDLVPDGFQKAATFASETLDTAKVDGRAIAMRSVCRKLVAIAQKGIVLLLKENKVSPGLRTQVGAFVKSDLGVSLVGGAMGVVMPLHPKLAKMPVAMEVARELRVEAGSRGLDKVLDGLTDRFMPEVFSAFATLDSLGATEKG